MKPLRVFTVKPYLPTVLEPLRTLAYNLYFSWNTESQSLWRRMDPELWEAGSHNPVWLLGRVRQERLEELSQDQGFLAHMERVKVQLQTYLGEPNTWYNRHHQVNQTDCFAYFSAEFGLADCLPIYSGGLGILAGDHLKAASDLGLPLVGVGLLYQKGYFRQYLNPEGWQQERYPINDFYQMPMTLERRADGSEVRISVDYPGRKVQARIWRIDVGRVALYLLDTNIPENTQYDQDICDELYGGDLDLRIHQEIMLGIGGVLALRALEIRPTVYHMNEGHSAFLGIERLRILIQEEGLTFNQAMQVAKSSQIFTTHTPVPAGIDLFPPDKLDYYLGRYYAPLGLSREQFLALGRENTGDFSAPFSMAVLAINLASFVNGVSKLHGAVSRQMFGGLWHETPVEEVPITSITNGVHARTWVDEDLQALYDRYLGPSWSETPPTHPLWQQVELIPDGELWRIHERAKARLVTFTRQRLYHQAQQRGAGAAELNMTLEALNPDAFTIGFARRFATYKRATLLLQDPERLAKILTHPEFPTQIIFAGKAHPKDHPGKELIRAIVQFGRQTGLADRMVFIEDYDMHVTGLMVAGVDVWLNTPLRPREASGTSGMKAAMNGAQNLSVLDGWWDEADYHRTGWPIGQGEDYNDRAYQDEVESNAIYDLLEKEIVPLFYRKSKDGLPRQWIHRLKNTIQLNAPLFSTWRMVQDYAEQAYFPVSGYFNRMHKDDYAPAKALAAWQQHLVNHWYEVEIGEVLVEGSQGETLTDKTLNAHQNICVQARLRLKSLQPQDLTVQVYQGSMDEAGNMLAGRSLAMDFVGMEGDTALFRVELHYSKSGLQGLGLRILPHHADLHSPQELRLLRWA
ncbi:MAG: glycosyltransferase family 1 protein [Synechococcales cyanobacterium]